MFVELTDEQKIYAFRRCLALYFICYWLQFVFDLDLYFFRYLPNTGVFLNANFFDGRYFIFALLIVLNLYLFIGRINRPILMLLIFLTWNFNGQNPLLKTEAQPMSFFMLISFMFLPLNQNYKLDKFYLRLILSTVGLYYFMAGLAKITDSYMWQSGSALQKIFEWEIMAKNISLSNWVITNIPNLILRASSYLALIFELSFVFLLFSRYRKILIPFGLIYHVLIFLFFDVGNISQLMLVWYILI